MLTPLVRRLLENEAAAVLNWRAQPVAGGFGHAYRIERVQGEAQVGDATLPWSLILKVIGPATGSPQPSAKDYWQREALVYQSDLLADLPGDLRAPRVIAVVEQPGPEYWLWLEDVVEREAEWSLERYGLAARHLGHFNGVYLAGKAIPQLPWLAADQLRPQVAMAEPGIAELPRLRPLHFAALLSEAGLERSLRIWAERRRLLATLDRLPRTLCHHDAFRRNLIDRQGPNGRSQTVAIDWSQVGMGAVGAEIAQLLCGSRFVALDPERIAELGELIFAGYVAGLRDVGWQGDTRLAHFGYTATAALSAIADIAIKWPRVARRVAALPAGVEAPRLLNPGGPAQAAAEHLLHIKLGEEACALLDQLGS